MSRYVMNLLEIDQSQVAVAGGKGANLGELSRIQGVHVPSGFCVTTDAFKRVVADTPGLDAHIDQLSNLKPDEHESIRRHSSDVRHLIEQKALPRDLAQQIRHAVAGLGSREGFAVRSSATAEDSPTTSFAGQHDTFLNVFGAESIIEHVRKCWASAFSERAVTYRMRNGIDHRMVAMAVIVQHMVRSKASGVLFTADPVSGNRNVAAIEAVAGLGDALVSGLSNADRFQVRDNRIVASTPAASPTLTEAQAVRLTVLGRRIEAHFGRPQDIEWCLDGDEFFIVQSRPITTLFPIPPRDDSEPHVYLSTGHQQMMTDAMKPLGISVWQRTGAVTFHVAGGRMFVDVTGALGTEAGRARLMAMAGASDPLTGNALQTIIDRGFVAELPTTGPAGASPVAIPAPIEADATIVQELVAESEASIAVTRREIATKSGVDLLEFIRRDFDERKRLVLDPRTYQAIVAVMDATLWLNQKLLDWLGEKNVADVLTQSVPNNVTSEMGLALLDVADTIRPHNAVVAFLEKVDGDAFLDELPKLAGGRESRDAIVGWLEKYGMRGPGEIDITRPRWSEQPRALIPLLLGNIRNFPTGEAKRRFERGLEEANKKEQDVLARLRALPDGVQKADETKRMIDRLRTFAGYREYPKYAIVRRYFMYKRAFLQEAERLVHAGVLRDKEDIFFLSFDELEEVVKTNRVDETLIRERKEAHRWHQTLTPPRVLTSEGEAINGSLPRDNLPPDALVGLVVSAGVVEGRARVVLDMSQADIQPGDILVTKFTDPSWTPLFVSISGLVTEVGGLMSHGAVIAREYGLPAIVGVANATRMIPDGQRIRINGTGGYVEILT